MKILYITNRVPYPVRDGGSVAMMQMLESLLKLGYDVKMLSLNTSKHFTDPSSLPEIFWKVHLETSFINTDVTLKGAFMNLFSESSYNVERFISPEFSALISKTLKAQLFDVVIFEGLYCAPYLSDVRSNSKARCVLRAHNVEYEIWQQAAGESKRIKRTYFNFLAARLRNYETAQWPLFDGIIAITGSDLYTMQSCCKTSGTACISLPTAIDTGLIKPEMNASNLQKVFHLGSMDWIPNQQAMEWFLKEVWPVVARDTKAQFYMAGRNTPDSFQEFAGDRVHIDGEVADAFAYMADKQLMVVPLFAGSGVRIKILEGMAAGKTIITTSLGVQGIDAYHEMEVLIANNAKAFAEAIVWCIKNPVKALQLASNARKLIEQKYSTDSFETSLHQYLQSLIAG